MRNNNTNPKPSLTSVRLSQRTVELLQDLEEFFHHLEIEGCPAATVARFRKSIQIAAAQTLAESAQRNLLLLEIEQSAAKLRPKRFLSGPPPGSAAALDEIEKYASQLRDEAEKQLVLKRVGQLRRCL